MNTATEGALPPERPREAPFAAAPAAAPPALAPAESPRVTHNTGGIINSVGEAKSVIFSVGGQPSLAAAEWSDPSLPPELSASLDCYDLPRDAPLAQLREHRILVVECPWSELQWRAASTFVRELGFEHKARCGVISDVSSYDSTLEPARPRGRFSLEDLRHASLGPDARVLLLELNGAAGSAYFDSHFASPGSLRALIAVLREADRYLLLLPRGPQQTRARYDRAGQRLPRVIVPFLPLWLHKRFGEDGEPLQLLIDEKLRRDDWTGEDALFEWLDQLDPKLGAADMTRALSDDSGEPRPLQTVREALDRCDEKDEVFLTAVFTATYLPALPQHELSEVVQALLGARTRRLETGRDQPPLELALTDEWKRTARFVLKQADLEIRQSSSGVRVVSFRAANALQHLRRELDAAPMFVESQLEHLQRSGLLFHLRPAIRDAVIELLLATTASEPGRLTADWLLKMLGRRNLQAGPTTEVTSSAEGDADPSASAEWVSSNFLCVAKLLRRLIDAEADGLALVNGVLGGMLHRKQLVKAGIELTYQLRHAPGFDVWRWLRRGVEVATKAQLESIERQLLELVDEPESAVDALRTLFSWLQNEGEKRSALGNLATKAIGAGMGASFVPTQADGADLPPPMISLLQEEAPSVAPGKGLPPIVAALAKHMDIEWVGSSHLARLLLPARLFEALPLEVRQRREHDFETQWEEAYQANLSSWEAGPRRAALRLTLCLAAWYLAHPHQAALLRSVTAAASAHLGADRRAAQEWLGRLDQILTRCEASAAADLTASEEQRRQWVRESRAQRRLLLELRDWLATSTLSAPDLSSRKDPS